MSLLLHLCRLPLGGRVGGFVVVVSPGCSSKVRPGRFLCVFECSGPFRARDGSSSDGVPQPPHLVFSGVDPRRSPPHVVSRRGSNYSSVIRRAQALRPSFGEKSRPSREPAGQRLATSCDRGRGWVESAAARSRRHAAAGLGPFETNAITAPSGPIRSPAARHSAMTAPSIPAPSRW